jgi:hypothetical protein
MQPAGVSMSLNWVAVDVDPGNVFHGLDTEGAIGGAFGSASPAHPYLSSLFPGQGAPEREDPAACHGCGRSHKPPEHGTGFRQMINTVYSTMLWLLRLGLVHINRVTDRHRAE